MEEEASLQSVQISSSEHLSDLKINPQTQGLIKLNQAHNSKYMAIQQSSLVKVGVQPQIVSNDLLQGSINSSTAKATKSQLTLNQTPLKNKKKGISSVEQAVKEEQTDLNQYHQLTVKLEKALTKISNPQHTIAKASSQGDNLMIRFEEFQEKKKKTIVKKKEENENLKVKELKQKPTIDKNSEKISKEIGHTPIYLRVQKLVSDKKKKYEENEQLKKKRQEQAELHYIQEYNKHVKKPENIRSYDDYFSEMVRWKEKSAQQNREKLEMKQSKELQGITFTPVLNQKSKKMALSHPRLPIQSRGLIKKQPTSQPIASQFKKKKLAMKQ